MIMVKPDPLVKPLTKRELEILSHLAENHSNNEIAANLSLSLNSVKWYVRQIYDKLGVENRRQAVSSARELGILAATSQNAGVSHPNNLPLQLNAFIGREKEIAEVTQLLDNSRIVTLHGSGGTGKTRLALEAAARLDHFTAGIWLVELAPQSDQNLVSQTIATALNLQRISAISYLELLINYLRDKKLLLILDNCEHLLDASAQLANTLLRSCPQLTLLVTSREALGIAGEVAYRVPSLAIPDSTGKIPADLAQVESVRLFIERAEAVLPDVLCSDQALIAAADLCRRLDGIPLAIELAAARVSVLSVEQIATRLDHAFHLLTGGSRTALPRQRTLRASIDWSYSLLSGEEKCVLQRLSVFSGGWSIEAAEQVCAFDGLETWDILDLLTSLVNKSLVVANPTANGAHRYRMLEIIRQFAQEKLTDAGQGEITRDSHLAYFMALAEDFGPLLRTSRIAVLLNQLDLEVDNLRGAIAWAIDKKNQDGAEKALRIVSALQYFWFTRSLVTEVIDWVELTLPLLSATDLKTIDLRAKALYLSGFLLVVHSIISEKAVEWLTESVQLFRKGNNQRGEALALCQLHLAYREISAPGYRKSDPQGEIISQDEIGDLRAQSLKLADNLVTQPDTESRWTAATIYGWIDWTPPFVPLQQEPDREERIQAARRIFIELGDRLGELNTLMEPYINEGLPEDEEYPLNHLTSEQGIQMARSVKSKFHTTWLSLTYGMVSYQQGQFQQMIDHFKEVRRFLQETGNRWGETWANRVIGTGYYYLDEIPQALAYIRESMSLSTQVGDTNGIYACLIFLAGISAKSKEFSRAVKILGFTEPHYEMFNERINAWDKIAFDQISAQMKLVFSEDEYDSLWQLGRALTLDQALTEAVRTY